MTVVTSYQTIPDGGIWEENEWKLIHNYIIDRYETKTCSCPHKVMRDNLWIIPRVIQATNEGGQNTTGVCVDCVLAAIGGA